MTESGPLSHLAQAAVDRHHAALEECCRRVRRVVDRLRHGSSHQLVAGAHFLHRAREHHRCRIAGTRDPRGAEIDRSSRASTTACCSRGTHGLFYRRHRGRRGKLVRCTGAVTRWSIGHTDAATRRSISAPPGHASRRSGNGVLTSAVQEVGAGDKAVAATVAQPNQLRASLACNIPQGPRDVDLRRPGQGG